MLINLRYRSCCVCKKRGDNLNAKGISLTQINYDVNPDIFSFFNIPIEPNILICRSHIKVFNKSHFKLSNGQSEDRHLNKDIGNEVADNYAEYVNDNKFADNDAENK